MQKVKHDFQLANKEISSGNVYMIRNCFTLFDLIQTVNCMEYSERICCKFNSILKLDRKRAYEISLLHTRNTSKIQKIALIEKNLFGP